MEKEKQKSLEHQARYLFRRLFHAEPSHEVVKRFTQAHRFLLQPDNPARIVPVDQLVAKKLDAEAIELSLRLRSIPNTLSQKIQILVYIAEIQPGLGRHFRRDTDGFFHGAAHLAGGIFRSAYLFIKGTWLIKKHGIL